MDGDRQLPATVAQGSLITAPSVPPAGSKPWSKGLGSLLLREDEDGRSANREAAVRLIAINPTLRAEAERLLPILADLKQPASREEIAAIVAREMPAWGVSAKHAAEYGVTYASYADALEGLSGYAIEEGVVRWNRGEGQKAGEPSGFPPRPPQLHYLATLAQGELRMAEYRARLALDYVEKKAPRQIPEEEQRAVAQGLADLAKSIRSKGMPEPRAPGEAHRRNVVSQLRAMAPKSDDVGDVL